MFVMDCYGHKLSNGVLFAHHLILDVPGGSSHLGYRRRVPLGHNPPTRVNTEIVLYTGFLHEGARTHIAYELISLRQSASHPIVGAFIKIPRHVADVGTAIPGHH